MRTELPVGTNDVRNDDTNNSRNCKLRATAQGLSEIAKQDDTVCVFRLWL